MRTKGFATTTKNFKLISEQQRKYYKYQPQNWVQPTLSSNGTLGGSSFAVSASNEYSSSYRAYKAFDGSSSTNWLASSYSNSDLPQSLIFYNETPINVQSIKITNRGTYATYATAGNVYGCNDNSSWELIGTFTNTTATTTLANWNIDLSSNAEYYKYHKIEFTQATWSTQASNGFGVNEVDITAYTRTIVNSTEADYDFYRDVDVFKAIRSY